MNLEKGELLQKLNFGLDYGLDLRCTWYKLNGTTAERALSNQIPAVGTKLHDCGDIPLLRG